MSILFIREPTNIPNVKNSDDARLFRYATSAQNGYIKNRGVECGYVINGSIFTITSGEIIIQGYDIAIDSNGASITVDNVATKRYYSVYVELNLTTQSVAIKALYDTAGYPIVTIGDDLTENTNGIARIEVYKFDALSAIISNVTRVIKPVNYAATKQELLQGELIVKTAKDALNFLPDGNIESSLKSKAEFYKGSGSETLEYPIGSIFLCISSDRFLYVNSRVALSYAFGNVGASSDEIKAAKFDVQYSDCFKGVWVARGMFDYKINYSYLVLAQRIE